MVKVYFEKTDSLTPAEQSVAAHSLLKRKLAQHYNISEEYIEIKKDSRGAPFVDCVEDVFVSLSHTKGLVACAFADSMVGVDVEAVGIRRKSVEKRVFSDNESSLVDSAKDENTAFFTLWTLKESWLKALGTGFAGNAKEIEFLTLENPIISNQSSATFFVEKTDGYIISLCLLNNK